MLLVLLKIELLKLKRSSSILMVVALPGLVILFATGIALKGNELSRFDPDKWNSWWVSIIALWCYFMLPLYIALATTLVNGIEHRNNAWRLMFTLPVNRYQFYVAKFLTTWLLISTSMLILWVSGVLCMLALTVLGAPVDLMWGQILLYSIPKMAVTCLPITVIQHAISWRFDNIIIPLAIGIIATMGIVQIGSSEFWVYYPWSYMLISSLGSEVVWQHQSLVISLVLATILLLGSGFYLTRRIQT